MNREESIEFYSFTGYQNEYKRVKSMGHDFNYDSYSDWLNYERMFASHVEKQVIDEILEHIKKIGESKYIKKKQDETKSIEEKKIELELKLKRAFQNDKSHTKVLSEN